MNIYDFISPPLRQMHFYALVSLMCCGFAPYRPHELHVPQSGAGRSVKSELQLRETLALHGHGCELEMSYIPLHACPESCREGSFRPIPSRPPSEHLRARELVLCGVRVLQTWKHESRARVSRHMADPGEGQGCHWAGTATTSAEETRLSAHDRFTPVTQRAEVRRP